MRSEEARFLWLFVFFDLPVTSKADRKAASAFREFLKDDGFMMMQFSVYARAVRAEEGVEKHVERVRRNLPKSGSVRALQVTDKQYARMRCLLGTKPKNESHAGEQLILL